MDQPEQEGFLREDPPSLDALCDSPARRFHALEEHIRQIEPRVQRQHECVDAIRAGVRKREEDIFCSFGVEHDYMDGPAIEPKYAVFNLLEVPSGRAVIYSDDRRTLRRIGETIQDKMNADIARLDIHLADAIRWMRCLTSFREDLGVRYAIIEAVGEENPADPMAQVYTVGAAPGVAITLADMRTGASQAAGLQEDMTREEFLGGQVQKQIKEAHHACTHNTYIITHPSDVLDQYQLGIMSGRILQVRWLAMHLESVN